MEQNTAIPPSQPGNEPTESNQTASDRAASNQAASDQAASNQAASNQAAPNQATEPVDAVGSSRPGGSIGPAESTGPVRTPGDTPARFDDGPTAPTAGPDGAPDGPAEEATPGTPAEPSTPARSGESETGPSETGAGPSETGAGPGNAAGAAAPPGTTTDAGSTAPVLDAAPAAGPDARGTEPPGRDRLSARLRRNPDGKMIAGVCTGMGDAWGIDPVLARLLFVAVGVIFFPIGPLAYVVFWMLMPEKD